MEDTTLGAEDYLRSLKVYDISKNVSTMEEIV